LIEKYMTLLYTYKQTFLPNYYILRGPYIFIYECEDHHILSVSVSFFLALDQLEKSRSAIFVQSGINDTEERNATRCAN